MKAVVTMNVISGAVSITLLFMFFFVARLPSFLVILHPNLNSSPHALSTIVTAWFPLEKSKHSLQEYHRWIASFIGHIDAPVVIFTTWNESISLRSIRGNLTVKIVTDYTPWTVPALVGVEKEYREHQHAIDPEKGIHGPDLYAVWNAKPWFLAEMSRKNPFRSKFFFWVDIGSFREHHTLRRWPDPDRVHAVFASGNDSILLGSVSKYPTTEYLQNVQEKDEGFHEYDRIQGTFFGGSASAVKWWEQEFYKVHNADLSRGRFVGKDQTIMNKVAALNFKDTIIIEATDQCGCGVQSWFYFQPFLANPKEVSPTCSPKPPLHFKYIQPSNQK